MECFEKWLHDSSFEWPSPGRSLLRIAALTSSGHGLISCENVQAGACLLSIPLRDLRLILTPIRCITFLNMCGCFSCAIRPYSLSDPLYALVLFLYHLLEHRLPDCPVAFLWRPYVNILPQMYSDPIFIISKSNTVSSMFEGTGDSCFVCEDLKFHVDKCLARLRKAWNALKPLVLDDTKCATNVPPAAFVWAWCTVNSRCVHCQIPECLDRVLVKSCAATLGVSSRDYENNIRLSGLETSYPSLIPFFDLLNHHPDRKGQLKVDLKTDTLRFAVDYDLKAEEEVYFTYGPHDNLTLFSEYGFCLPATENPYDAIFPSLYDLLWLIQPSSSKHPSCPISEHHLLSSTLSHLGLSSTVADSSVIWPTVCISRDGPSYHLILILYIIHQFNSQTILLSELYKLFGTLFLIDSDSVTELIGSTFIKLVNRLIDQVVQDQDLLEHSANSMLSYPSFFEYLSVLFDSKKSVLQAVL